MPLDHGRPTRKSHVGSMGHQSTGTGDRYRGRPGFFQTGFFNIRSVIMTDGEGEWDGDSGDEEQSEECDDEGLRV